MGVAVKVFVAVRVGVDQPRIVLERLVDLDHLAGDGRVDLGHRLDRFDRPQLVARVEQVSDLRQLDEDHLAELGLGEVGDADDAGVVLDPHPLVVARVAIVGRIHASLLLAP